MIRFACPVCLASVTAPLKRANRRGRCPKCRVDFLVPAATPHNSRPADWHDTKPTAPIPAPAQTSALPEASAAPEPASTLFDEPEPDPSRTMILYVVALLAVVFAGAILGVGIWSQSRQPRTVWQTRGEWQATTPLATKSSTVPSTEHPFARLAPSAEDLAQHPFWRVKVKPEQINTIVEQVRKLKADWGVWIDDESVIATGQIDLAIWRSFRANGVSYQKPDHIGKRFIHWIQADEFTKAPEEWEVRSRLKTKLDAADFRQ